MFKNKRIIAVIPARSGSKRLPNKNIKNFNGYPLLYWSIIAAKKVKIIDKIYVSTNSLKIKKIAEKLELTDLTFLSQKNIDANIGSGMIGKLKNPMSSQDFLKHIKSSMDLKCIRHTDIGDKSIQKVAICGGSGSFLLKEAMKKNADAYVTSDFKYHEFFDSENKTLIADIGHYESEVFTKDLFYEFLSQKFSNIAVLLSNVNTNPISYYI